MEAKEITDTKKSSKEWEIIMLEELHNLFEVVMCHDRDKTIMAQAQKQPLK